MNRQLRLASVACLALSGAVVPLGQTAAQDTPQSPLEAASGAPASSLDPADLLDAAEGAQPAATSAAVPSGRAANISNWALAGVVWSDAQLVRRLAAAAHEQATSQERKDRMALLVEDCDALINSLESFGWRRIADARRAPVVPPVTPPAAEAVPAVEVEAAVEAEADSGLAARVETETPAGFDDPGLDDEMNPLDRPFNLGRYRVDDAVDEVPAEAVNTADAVEDGTEQALAAVADEAASGFENAGQAGSAGVVDRREVQTRSATLPYSTDSIYEYDFYHPNADYPRTAATVLEDAEIERAPGAAVEAIAQPEADVTLDKEDELIEDLTGEDQPRRPTGLDITRYTDAADRFSEDADWVKFRLAANQQRWLMIRDNIDAGSDPAFAEQVNAALLQLRADAAAALAASRDPELNAVLQTIID